MAKDFVKKDEKISNEYGFGQYPTAKGGGTPVGEHTSHPEGKGRGGYEIAGKPGKREEDQPRTEDGKFTYNAVNGKELKEVSKLNGHSRGTTIPPTLTGGENGHHYYTDKYHEETVEGVEDELDASRYFKKGAEIVGFDGKIKLAEKDFVEAMQEYVISEKGNEWKKKHPDAVKIAKKIREGEKFTEEEERKYKSLIKVLQKEGKHEGLDVEEWETKKGRHSKEEAQAIAEAKKYGTEGKQWVEDKKKEKETGEKEIKTYEPARKGDEGRKEHNISKEDLINNILGDKESKDEILQMAMDYLEDENVKDFIPSDKTDEEIIRYFVNQVY